MQPTRPESPLRRGKEQPVYDRPGGKVGHHGLEDKTAHETPSAGTTNDAIARSVVEHPLTTNASYLAFYADNGVPMRLQTGLELVQAAGRPLVTLLNMAKMTDRC